MPIFIMEVPELDLNVRRPVVDKIIRDLFDQTNIRPDDLNVIQMGSAEAIPALNSTMNQSSKKERLNSDTRVEITVSEEVTNKINAPVRYHEYPMIFCDEDLMVQMKTSYKQTKTTIDVTFISKSRADALNWMNAIQRQVSQRAFNPIHTVEYYYPIPIQYMYALSKIHELREKVAPYNESFGKWLRDHFTDTMTTVSNQAGKNIAFVIKEAQTNIIGYYDFSEEPPKPEKGNGETNWTVNFSYSFWYERPADCLIEYPIVIHNQIIPKDIRDDRDINDLYPQRYTLTNSGQAFAHFNAYNREMPRFDPYTGSAVPHFDDWFPNYFLPNYESMIRVATCIDPSQPKWVGSLLDVFPYEYNKAIVEYMKDEYKWLNIRCENLFLVSLHRFYQLYATSQLIIDKDLNVFSKEDLGLRDMWHLDTDICNDISVLSDRALDALGKHPDAFDAYVDAYYPGTPLDELERNPDGNYDLGKIKDAIDDIADGVNVKFPKRPAQQRFVGIYTIIADRQGDL